MLRFQLGPSAQRSGFRDLRGAHLLGADAVPVRGELRMDNGEIACDPRQDDPTGLSLLWPVPEYGAVQIETTRLPQRAKPFLLPLELVRQRLMRINIKREEWGLFDYPAMDDFAGTIDEARALFVQALQAADQPERAATLSEQALHKALTASEEMCSFHANVFLNRRHQTGGFARPFLGVAAPNGAPKQETLVRIRGAFDFLRLPLVWREVQPKENVLKYDVAESWAVAAKKAGLGLLGGPLLNFGVRFVPDWMYIWENDFETIFEYAQEHLRKTVKRFADKVQTWIVASGLHADNALAFSFEQVMELTRMATNVARAAAPRAKILIELVQPWGEYYGRNQQTIPPFLYADMLVQSGINFDGFGLQLLFGIESDGFHFRDPLQVSALIDRLANLGKPIHVTALAAPSGMSHATGGSWRGEWTEQSQAAWIDATTQLALSKPYVECVCLHELMDGPETMIPSSGLIAANGAPKPVLAKLSQLRTRLQNPPEK